MTSKKGAIEDTNKKSINLARRGPEKEVLKIEDFLFFLFWREEGVRGDLGGSVGGGPPSSRELRRKTWRETSSAFCENRGFQLRRPQLLEVIENRGQSLPSDRAKSFIGYQGPELKL